MKTVRLNAVGTPLQVINTPDPVLRPGSVLVRVEALRLLSYTEKAFAPDYKIPVPVPFTPGTDCIGVVEAVADDVCDLTPGLRVFCDPDIVSRMNVLPRLAKGGEAFADGILNGFFGLTTASDGLLRFWKDGSFAEKALYPAECLTPIEGTSIEGISADPTRLACLANLAVAYGGLLQGEMKPGQIVVINGATGNIGTAAVIMALALGASKVVAVGRDRTVLDELVSLAPKRVIAAVADASPEENARRIADAAGGAHVTLDTLGGVLDPALTLAGLHALRPGGSLILMGGVTADIPIPYGQMLLMGWTIRGSFMYPASAPGDLLRMLSAGTLDLAPFRPQVFGLDQVNEAIAAATAMKGLNLCVLMP